MNTEARKHAFQKISLKVSQSVYDDHERTTSKLWGFIRNKARQQVPFFGSTSITTKVSTGVQLGAKAAAMIPALSKLSPISAALPFVVPAIQGRVLYARACKTDDAEDKAKFLAEYTAVSGAQKVADAVRKLNDARDTCVKTTSIKTCKDMVDLLYTFNYYCYRIQRLRQYANELTAYVAALQARIDQAEKDWESLETATNDGLFKAWDDPTWHNDCGNDCTFPSDLMDISPPTPPKPGQFAQTKPVPPPLPPKPGQPFAQSKPGAPPLPPKPGRR